MSAIRETKFTDNGGFKVSKDNCNIILKTRNSGVVYCPKMDEASPGAMYPRVIELQHNGEANGTLLATFEQYTHGMPVFPIFRSTDGGLRWSLFSQVEDTELGWGARFQPQLFELPVKCGDLEAGTILCAGNMIPQDRSKTAIHLYKSSDAGKTWEFMSEIARGGMADTDPDSTSDETRPVWEPYFYMNSSNELVCYYSDEGYFHSDNCNQLLLHKTSKDGGYTWGDVVIDIAMPDKAKRPGMPIVTKLPNGKYLMVYEIVNVEGIPVFFRYSDDAEDWGDPAFLGHPVVAMDGTYISGTPFVTWINRGGENGTILVSGRGFDYMLANSNLGEGFWEKIPTPVKADLECVGVNYSQTMIPIQGGKQLLSLCPTQVNPDLSMIAYAISDIFEK